jgi:hypothetical protein
MNKPLRPVWGIFIVLCAVVGVSMVAKAMRPKEIVPWRTDFAASVEEARRENKPVMAYFTATWCGPCQTLKHTTWADKGVAAALEKFVPVKIDVDRQPELAQKYVTEGIPAFAVIDPDGTPRKAAVGAMPPADFVAWLNKS